MMNYVEKEIAEGFLNWMQTEEPKKCSCYNPDMPNPWVVDYEIKLNFEMNNLKLYGIDIEFVYENKNSEEYGYFLDMLNEYCEHKYDFSSSLVTKDFKKFFKAFPEYGGLRKFNFV